MDLQTVVRKSYIKEDPKGCRKYVTRVLSHHSNGMCSPSDLVVKPTLGLARFLIFIFPEFYFLLNKSFSAQAVFRCQLGISLPWQRATCSYNSFISKMRLIIKLFVHSWQGLCELLLLVINVCILLKKKVFTYKHIFEANDVVGKTYSCMDLCPDLFSCDLSKSWKW